MATVQAIVPCLWFDDQAEEAASFYVSVFPRPRYWRLPVMAGPASRCIAVPRAR